MDAPHRGDQRARPRELRKRGDDYKAAWELAESELTALREEVERLKTLVTDKEPNGYPLWFNRAVHDCNDCDSEDLCARHWKMADSDFANCESEVAAFLAALSPSPAQQEHNES